MSKGNPVPFKQMAVAVLLLGLPASVRAQSPYGLSARQTIPWVIDLVDERGTLWNTEIDVLNPGPASITLTLTYLGAVGTATPGSIPCNPVTVASKATVEFTLHSVCPLAPGPNFGRLEMSSLPTGGFEEPSDLVFTASARVTQVNGGMFTVEGFPEGYLSGNKTSAATGLKNGSVDGSQWRSFCAAAVLNDTIPVFVSLVDGAGNPLGMPVSVILDPSVAIDMESFPDVFAAVGAPGNFTNVTARFSTPVPGPGVFAVCMIVDNVTGQRAFEVAKYLDNNDEGRQHVTSVSKTAYGRTLAIVSELPRSRPVGFSDLLMAYFQHPDRVFCTVDWNSPHSTFDQVQMRLLDPDGNIVAGGPHQNNFIVDLAEKPQRHGGRNGRWLVEVAPDRTYGKHCGGGLGLCPGGLEETPYTVTCSSGNGHNTLDPIGHCQMACPKDPATKMEFLCGFDNPFDPTRCQAF